MSISFNLLDSKYLLAEINGSIFLISTGIPFSISLSGSVTIGEHEFIIPDEAHGITQEKFTEGFSENVTGIIGMDILRQFNFTINREAGVIIFSDEPSGIDGAKINFELFHGSYILANIDIHGRPVKCIVDTSVKYSMTHAGFVEGFLPVFEGAKEFGLMPGWYYTDYYDLPVNIGDNTLVLRFGLFPDSMAGMMNGLMAMGIEVIFGNDITSHFNLHFNLKSGYISIS